METRSFSAHGFRCRMGVFFIFQNSCLVKCFLCLFGKVHLKQIVFLASWCWQVANVERVFSWESRTAQSICAGDTLLSVQCVMEQ